MRGGTSTAGWYFPSSPSFFFYKVDLAYDICLVELASPMVESEMVGFAELPAIPEVRYEDIQCMFDSKTIGTGGT